jgi:hypothetical protein
LGHGIPQENYQWPVIQLSAGNSDFLSNRCHFLPDVRNERLETDN